MWRCHQLLSGFLANDHLPQLSRQSRLSAKGKNDNEVKQGEVHRSPSIYLTIEESPGKHQLRDRLIKAVRIAIDSNGVPYPYMRSLGPHSMSGREKKVKIG
jgi:hypothetical protein